MNAVPAHVAGVAEIIMVVPTPVRGSVATGGSGGATAAVGERNDLVLAAAYGGRRQPRLHHRRCAGCGLRWRYGTAERAARRQDHRPGQCLRGQRQEAMCSARWAST